MSSENITAGTIAIAKVGRNEVEVTVLEKLEDGWKVRSNKSGREFKVRAIERVEKGPVIPLEDETPNPAPESNRVGKKLSLLEAAVRILRESPTPMSCKEIVVGVVAAGFWIPTAAKTPEQSLYSAVFREINGKEHPRFRKSATRKGAFEFTE